MNSLSQLQFSTEHATTKLPSCMLIRMKHGLLCMRAQSLQSCPTLCNPMDYSPPGFSVHGILQARILEWVTMPSSGNQTRVSCIADLFFTAEPLRKPYGLLLLLRVSNKPYFFRTPAFSFTWCFKSKVLLKFSGAEWEGRELWFVSLKCFLLHPNYHFKFPGMILTTSAHFHN